MTKSLFSRVPFTSIQQLDLILMRVALPQGHTESKSAKSVGCFYGGIEAFVQSV
jgi:hypothetical protein